MSTRTATIVTAFAASLVLAACSTADAPTETGDTTPAADGVTGTAVVYAAASLEVAFTELVAEFEDANPEASVEVVYDGSSTLVTQLIEGAEADVLATADEATMADLVDAGLANDPQSFATNTLVIAVAPGNPLGIESLDDLEGLDYVVCAPEVPCGAATEQVFDGAGLEIAAVSEEQNVTAVTERVVSGEVDAGLVYATDVASRADVLEGVVFPGADEVVNRYPIVALDGASDAGAAFIDLVQSDEGQALLAEHGFGAP